MAYTEKERTILERVKKAPFPTDYKGLREAINSTIGGTNAKPPEIGALSEDVGLRRVCVLTSRCPRALDRFRSSSICTAADGLRAAPKAIASLGCSSPKPAT